MVTEFCQIVAALGQGQGADWLAIRAPFWGERLALHLLATVQEYWLAYIDEYQRITSALEAYCREVVPERPAAEGVGLRLHTEFFCLPLEIKGLSPEQWFYPTPPESAQRLEPPPSA
jgi:hypothetical protein